MLLDGELEGLFDGLALLSFVVIDLRDSQDSTITLHYDNTPVQPSHSRRQSDNPSERKSAKCKPPYRSLSSPPSAFTLHGNPRGNERKVLIKLTPETCFDYFLQGETTAMFLYVDFCYL